MTKALSRHSVVHGQFFGQLGAVGFGAILAFAGIACTTPAIEGTGGTSGTGRGGAAGSGANGGGGGSGTVIKLDGSVTSTGGTGGTTGCTGTTTPGCIPQFPEGCGDGINNQGGIEQCDDGNVVPGDGCNGACKVEKNWTCPKQGRCTRNIVCGDGQVGPGEVCDDANIVDNDGCNSTCTVRQQAHRGGRGLRRRQHQGRRRLQQHVQARGRLGLPESGPALQGGPTLRRWGRSTHRR